MKNFIKNLLQTIGVISVVTLSLSLFDNSYEPQFSHKMLRDIKPTAIIDDYTLINREGHLQIQHMIFSKLIENEVLFFNPLVGVILNKNHNMKHINIIIESNGGYVDVGFNIINILEDLKKLGISVNCYISKAASMAFTIMVQSCDRKIAVGTFTLMQHRTSMGYDHTASTFLLDLEIAKEESKSLNVNYEEWLKLTKGKEDHFFTEEEKTKYRLVDSYYEY